VAARSPGGANGRASGKKYAIARTRAGASASRKKFVQAPMNKSFLVLFFKKEPLSFFAA
jgi:hypothetical protein